MNHQGDVGFYIKAMERISPTRDSKMRSLLFRLCVLPYLSEGWMISDVITIP